MPTILLTGDVMLGRGIDQIHVQSNSPELYEPFCRSALDYVALAERSSGPIPRQVGRDYIWGDALADLRSADARIINLETAITCADVPARKGIHYRCHPANWGCLSAAGIDCCVLANNHVLDWGAAGLVETLDTLEAAGLRLAGAGRDLPQAESPAFVPMPEGGRVLVYAVGSSSSGIPRSWAAGPSRAGVNLLDRHALHRLSAQFAVERRPGDLLVVSIHWGGNWGYDIPDADRDFAHQLIDAGADIVHGHSSHHPKAMEFHRGKPILYGCGDFLNDYEGITGEESYRPDLVLAYRATFDSALRCSRLELLPYRIAKFRLNRATAEEANWLATTMDRECRRFGAKVELDGANLRVRQLAEDRVR